MATDSRKRKDISETRSDFACSRITYYLRNPKKYQADINADVGLLRAECDRLKDHLCNVRVDVPARPIGFHVERMRTDSIASVRDPEGDGFQTKIVEGLEIVVGYTSRYDKAIYRQRMYVDGFRLAFHDDRHIACKYADAFALAVTERAKAEPLAVRKLAALQEMINRVQWAFAELE